MTEAQTITFKGNTYSVSDFSDELKQTISAVQIAEHQISFHTDTLNVLSVGHSTLLAQLQELLKDVEPVVAPANDDE